VGFLYRDEHPTERLTGLNILLLSEGGRIYNLFLFLFPVDKFSIRSIEKAPAASGGKSGCKKRSLRSGLRTLCYEPPASGARVAQK